MAKLFGFEIKRIQDVSDKAPSSFAPPQSDDGATVVAEGGVFGTYVDLEGTARTEAELVNKYREMALQPEVEAAVEDIINESIVTDEDKVVDIILDEVDELSDNLKKRITEEFEEVLGLLKFSEKAYDIYRRWYIDGRLYFHAIIDENNVRQGITELRYIDPRKIKKIKEVSKKRQSGNDFSTTQIKNEY